MKRLYSWAGDSKAKKAVAFLADVLVTFVVIMLLLLVFRRISGGADLYTFFGRTWYIGLACSAVSSAILAEKYSEK